MRKSAEQQRTESEELFTAQVILHSASQRVVEGEEVSDNQIKEKSQVSPDL